MFLPHQNLSDEINRNAAKYDKERQEKIAREKEKLEKEKASWDRLSTAINLVLRKA